MVIFHSYVKLPEGTTTNPGNQIQTDLMPVFFVLMLAIVYLLRPIQLLPSRQALVRNSSRSRAVPGSPKPVTKNHGSPPRVSSTPAAPGGRNCREVQGKVIP